MTAETFQLENVAKARRSCRWDIGEGGVFQGQWLVDNVFGLGDAHELLVVLSHFVQ